MPSASEVAALIVGDIDQLGGERDIIVKTKSRRLQRLDLLHPMYLPMQYLLLFPYGEDGFRPDIPTANFVSGRTCNTLIVPFYA